MKKRKYRIRVISEEQLAFLEENHLKFTVPELSERLGVDEIKLEQLMARRKLARKRISAEDMDQF